MKETVIAVEIPVQEREGVTAAMEIAWLALMVDIVGGNMCC